MNRSVFPLLAAASVLLTACGGGTGDEGTAPGTVTPATRAQAATTTATSGTNACAAVRPFYWELGDTTGALASGSVGGGVDGSTVMAVASASKWLYGAYAVERRAGAPTDTDIAYLRFTSGFAMFDSCKATDTVGSCAATPGNASYNPLYDGQFFYGGAHMQQHAVQQMGLGTLGNAALATEVRRVLGTDIALSYFQPQLAGGVQTSAADYARFLRKLLRGDLQLGRQLGRNAVCTNPTTCPTAESTPIPTTESWHYSLGHWVEDDPAVGDGAFSSAGAFGFYPWIDAGRQHYGVLARLALVDGAGHGSARCGRLIRKAYATGVAL